MVYNLDGVDDLQLSPATLAQIFDGKITNWNDPAIAADNPDASCPSTGSPPVHRSDESGTTENFTDYLSKAAPRRLDRTRPAATGRQGRRGRAGHLRRRRRRQGRQGHDRLRRREPGRRASASRKIKVGDAFVAPDAPRPRRTSSTSSEGVRRAAASTCFTFDAQPHDDRGRRRTRSSWSRYQIACTKYDDADQGDAGQGLLSYIISAEGQQAAAKTAGSAPITDDAPRQQITAAPSTRSAAELSTTHAREPGTAVPGRVRADLPRTTR